MKNKAVLMKKSRGGFTLPEVMLIVAIAGILIISGGLKFRDLRNNIRIDRAKAQMKVLQIGLRMYYADVGLFPIKAKTGDGIGYDGLTDWNNYLMTGDRPGASANDEDTNNDNRIDNWHGKYIDEPAILTDPWGRSFVYVNKTFTDSEKSGILCWGPRGYTGAGAGDDWRRYFKSDGTPFSWAKGTKDTTDPPDDEGFSVFYRDGNPANAKTDFIMVLWME